MHAPIAESSRIGWEMTQLFLAESETANAAQIYLHVGLVGHAAKHPRTQESYNLFQGSEQ